jgi:hypothetical protein
MIKRLAAAAAALAAILIVGLANAQTDRVADKTAVEKTVKEVVTTFYFDDVKKVVSYFHEPWMQIGTGKVLNTAEEVEKWIAESRKSMTKDYDHFNAKQLSSKMLGNDFAVVSYLGERQAKDNKVLQTVAGSFFLKRMDTGWKIAAGIGYPPEDFIKLD